jgi:hypothetical protein
MYLQVINPSGGQGFGQWPRYDSSMILIERTLMEPIRVNIGRRWGGFHKELAKRLTDIVVGSIHHGPHWIESSSKWQLDDGNAWSMMVDGDDVVISYRYRGNMTQQQWDALKLVIEWALNN